MNSLSFSDWWAVGIWLLNLTFGLVATITWIKFKIKNHDVRIAVIEKKFVTDNGEPALMSFRAHKHICEQNNGMLMSEFNHVKETVEKQSTHIDEMGNQLGCTAKALAVLEEKIKK